MNEIDKWLRSGRDYGEGLQILAQYEPDYILLPKMRKGANAYNRSKLLQRMRILTKGKSVLVIAADPAPAAITELQELPQRHLPALKARGIEVKSQLFPIDISQAIDERASLVRQREKISNSLAKMGSDQKRRNGIKKIKSLQGQIAALSDKIEAYKRGEQQQAPEVESIKVAPIDRLSPAEIEPLKQALNYARTTLSKRKASLKKWQKNVNTDPMLRRQKLEYYVAQISQWEATVKQRHEKIYKAVE